MARPDAFRPNLATSLNNLAGCLSELGQREPALAAAQEAVDLYHELSTAQPEAFQPDLAVSSAVLANCLEAMERPTEALRTSWEAIATLRKPFLALPSAFTHQMVPILLQYFARTQKLGVEPDRKLLGPILAVLAPDSSDGDDTDEEGTVS